MTIGSRLEERAKWCENVLEKYYYEMIGDISLRRAARCLREHLRSKYAVGHMSYMSPSSIKDWPIEQQRELLLILNSVHEYIGVKLGKNLVMFPRKAISGVYFPTEISFSSCKLCPRKGCEGRRGDYSGALAREYGVLT